MVPSFIVAAMVAGRRAASAALLCGMHAAAMGCGQIFLVTIDPRVSMFHVEFLPASKKILSTSQKIDDHHHDRSGGRRC